jgi:tryptophan-rich sensory protein
MTQERPTRSDAWRAAALVAAAAAQILAGYAGGTGLWGEPVGEVANAYPTLLLPGGAAFTIWSLIYVAFAALAVRQALPTQRSRSVHRRTGWWLVAAGALNAGWVVLFSQRLILVAQLVIVVLLVCLALAAVRLRVRADGWGDRLLLHLPVAIYLGWVSMATVAGAATTAASFDSAPTSAVAVVVLALTGLAAAVAASRLPAVVGFAVTVCWALAWIASRTPDTAVQITALTAIGAVLLAALARLARTHDRSTTAWG